MIMAPNWLAPTHELAHSNLQPCGKMHQNIQTSFCSTGVVPIIPNRPSCVIGTSRDKNHSSCWQWFINACVHAGNIEMIHRTLSALLLWTDQISVSKAWSTVHLIDYEKWSCWLVRHAWTKPTAHAKSTAVLCWLLNLAVKQRFV